MQPVIMCLTVNFIFMSRAGSFVRFKIEDGKGRLVMPTGFPNQHATLYFDRHERKINLHLRATKDGNRTDLVDISCYTLFRILVVLRKHENKLMRAVQGVPVNPGWFKRQQCYLSVIDRKPWLEKLIIIKPNKLMMNETEMKKRAPQYQDEIAESILLPGEVANAAFASAAVYKYRRNGPNAFKGWVYRLRDMHGRWRLLFVAPRRLNRFAKEFYDEIEPYLPLRRIAEDVWRTASNEHQRLNKTS